MKKNIFISYSHQDEEWKDEIVKHLIPLSGTLRIRLEPWDDSKMICGDFLEPEIQAAIDNSEFAVLLISHNFLSSKFIMEKELPALLNKQGQEGTPRIMPFIIRNCDVEAHPWLEERLARPQDRHAPKDQYEKDKAMAKFAKEIRLIATKKIQDDESIIMSGQDENEKPESDSPESLPGEYVTNAFLIKKVLITFYGDVISDLAKAFADSEHPSYQDVPPNNPNFPFIEIAKGLSITNAREEFKPEEYATKSKILKVILITGDLPSITKPYPKHLIDITGHENEEYIISAYNNGVLNEYANDEINEGVYFEPDSPLQIDKFLEWIRRVSKNHDKVIQVHTKIPQLEISLSKANPEALSIPIKGMNIPLMVLDISNPSIEDIIITGIIIAHAGLGNSDEITAVKFFDGIQQRGRNTPFLGSEEIAPISLENKNVLVSAGTTKTVVVAIDIDTDQSSSGSEHEVVIVDKDDIIAVSRENGESVDISGNFPIKSETFRTTNVKIGELSVTFSPEPIFDRAKMNTENLVFAHMVIQSEHEDILIQSISLTFHGIRDGDIQNLFLFNQKEQIITKTIQSTKNKDVTFDLTASESEGFKVEKGSSKKIAIIGTPTVKGRVVKVDFNSNSDSIIAQGLSYGFGVNINTGGVSPIIQLI